MSDTAAASLGISGLEWLLTALNDSSNSGQGSRTLPYAEFRQWIRWYITDWPAKDRTSLNPVIRELTLAGSKLSPGLAIALFFAQLVECMSLADIVHPEPTLETAHRVLDNPKQLAMYAMRDSTQTASVLASCVRPFQLILVASFAAALKAEELKQTEQEDGEEKDLVDTDNHTDKPDTPNSQLFLSSGTPRDVFTACDGLPYGLRHRQQWDHTASLDSKMFADLLGVLFKLLRPQDNVFRTYIDTWYYGGGRESEATETKNERARARIMEKSVERAKKRKLGKFTEDENPQDSANDDDAEYDDDDDSIEFLLPGADEDDEAPKSKDPATLFNDLEQSLGGGDEDGGDDSADRVTRKQVSAAVKAYQHNSTGVMALLRAVLRVASEHSDSALATLRSTLSDRYLDILALAALVPHTAILLRPWLPPSHVQNTRFISWCHRLSSGLSRDCLTLLAKILGLCAFDPAFYGAAGSRADDITDAAYCRAATSLACSYADKLIPQLRLALRTSAKPPRPIAATGPSSRSQNALLSFLNQEADASLGAGLAAIGTDPYWRKFQIPKWIADWLIHFIFDASLPIDLSFTDDRASVWSYGRFILPSKQTSLVGAATRTEIAPLVESTPDQQLASLVLATRKHLLQTHLSDMMAMSLTLIDDSLARPNKLLGVRMCAKILHHATSAQLMETGWGFVALESMQRSARFKEEPELVDATLDTATKLFATLTATKNPFQDLSSAQQRIRNDMHMLSQAREQQRQQIGYLRAYEHLDTLLQPETQLASKTESSGVVTSLEQQRLIEFRTNLESALVETAFDLKLSDSAAVNEMRTHAGLPKDVVAADEALSTTTQTTKTMAPAIQSWLESYISELQYLAMSPPDDNAGSTLGDAASAGLLLNAIAQRRWLELPSAAPSQSADRTSTDLGRYQVAAFCGIPPLLTKLQLARSYARVSNVVMLALGPEGIAETASQILPPLFTLAAHHDLIVRAPALHAIGLALEICGSRLRVHARQILTWLVETYITLSDAEFIENVASLRYGLRGWIQARSPALLLDGESSKQHAGDMTTSEDSDDVGNMNDASAVANVIAETALAAVETDSDDEPTDSTSSTTKAYGTRARNERRLREQYERWRAANSTATDDATEADDFEQFKATYQASPEESRLEELLERYRIRKACWTPMSTTERLALGQAMESELAISREFVRHLIVQLFIRVGADVDLLDALRVDTSRTDHQHDLRVSTANLDSDEGDDDGDSTLDSPDWLPGLAPLGRSILESLEAFYLDGYST